jgi:hypothetical protein
MICPAKLTFFFMLPPRLKKSIRKLVILAVVMAKVMLVISPAVMLIQTAKKGLSVTPSLPKRVGNIVAAASSNSTSSYAITVKTAPKKTNVSRRRTDNTGQ